MMDYPQRVSSSFNERMRLIRLRRKKEDLRFWNEFKLIPKWLIALVILLFLAAQVIAFIVNMDAARHGDIFPPGMKDDPALATVALAGLVTLMSLVIAGFIFLIAYVNRDAKRRGMNSTLWTLLVLISLPTWGLIGLIIYLLMREPLPYPCPQCSNIVGARFNFCPNCKCNLHPACPQCKYEVVNSDKYCPNCGNDLAHAADNVPDNKEPLSSPG
jgi:RNA polymerase subunit RPABC4/transcription elongation factor Spt4